MDNIVKQKNIFQSNIINIFTKYSIKFIIRIYENADSLKDFQKKLYKIPNWDFDKKDKEYKVFLKYVLKKFDQTEYNLTDTLEHIYICYIRIMSSLFNHIDIKIPILKDFWYKVVKKIGKLFYENPKLIKESLNYTIIKNTVEHVLQKYIPIKDIINSKKDVDVEPLYYNFSENMSENSENIEQFNINNVNLDIYNLSSNGEDNDSNYNNLKYISSEQFENDYYHSEDQSEHINLDDVEIKHIDFKK